MDNSTAVKIAVAGIGGVGGYIGGKLALHYSGNKNVEVSFICRGATHQAIHENGLQLIIGGVTHACFPDKLVASATELGEVDVLLVCTKTYSVNEVLKQYSNCITPDTIVITTQNTISGKDNIGSLLSAEQLVEGCIYISANRIAPGVIKQNAGPEKLIFGTNGKPIEHLTKINSLLKDAGIETILSSDINYWLWKKFMFVSAAAVATSVYAIPYAALTGNKEAFELYRALTAELLLIANKKGIRTDADTLESNCRLLETFSTDAMSSLLLDLKNGYRAEISSLVVDVINTAKTLNVAAISYQQSLSELEAQYPHITEQQK